MSSLVLLLCFIISLMPPLFPLFSTTLRSCRPGSEGQLSASETAIEPRIGSVTSGGGHHQVCREARGHRGTGEDQATGEKQQREGGMRASEGGEKSLQVSFYSCLYVRVISWMIDLPIKTQNSDI